MDAALAFFNNMGTSELLLIAMVGLLLFGKRLPEVGKSLGKTLVEFKKGMRGIEDQIDQASREVSSTVERPMLDESTPSVPTTQPSEAYHEPVPVETHPDPVAAEAYHEPVAATPAQETQATSATTSTPPETH